jgi:hypothetical protein
LSEARRIGSVVLLYSVVPAYRLSQRQAQQLTIRGGASCPYAIHGECEKAFLITFFSKKVMACAERIKAPSQTV